MYMPILYKACRNEKTLTHIIEMLNSDYILPLCPRGEREAFRKILITYFRKSEF